MKIIAATLLLVQTACASSAMRPAQLNHPAAKAERIGPICADCLDA